MKKLAVIYHSAHGNTRRIAELVAEGARTAPGVQTTLLRAEDLVAAPERLLAFDGFVFGSPTYLGGVSGTFKSFMDATGRLWKSHALKGRLASGFTVSALPSGDKQSTLMSMFVFAMQHGMFWVGNAILPEQHAGIPEDQAANRLGSWSGLMAQAGHSGPGAGGFAPGDLKTARMFGANIAGALSCMTCAPEAEAAA
ncbi:flavodoxin family protein [Ramlibacter alkalitolerans]|uniref:Flavoprotein WrbA n=1 Tax=Ramlibacter alkalitolerans TaxID=2039631 RepID=A0ABS1JIM3_9BURK|nr:flavodoxin family protein [Ramlibacter alkalitolerans]